MRERMDERQLWEYCAAEGLVIPPRLRSDSPTEDWDSFLGTVRDASYQVASRLSREGLVGGELWDALGPELVRTWWMSQRPALFEKWEAFTLREVAGDADREATTGEWRAFLQGEES